MLFMPGRPTSVSMSVRRPSLVAVDIRYEQRSYHLVVGVGSFQEYQSYSYVVQSRSMRCLLSGLSSLVYYFQSRCFAVFSVYSSIPWLRAARKPC